nr:4-alpha-glucanotransferase [Verrucomicrobium spinosum]
MEQAPHPRAGVGHRIVGDIPIFTAHDSADVWANRELFSLDENGNPTVIAGVPPDYFSETGQRWGNPLYDWPKHLKTNFNWWKSRMRKTLALVDVVRIDHFRGFAAYWEIPASEATAINGKWVEAPGDALFNSLKEEMGELPIIAEDLGSSRPMWWSCETSMAFPACASCSSPLARTP